MKFATLLIIYLLSFDGISQVVNIPDSNFKASLVGNPVINTNGDAEIQISEATAYSLAIPCYSSNITDLSGIESFVNITGLLCYNNQITSMDLSQNTKIEILNCASNLLTELDLSSNDSLTDINCELNQIDSLDLSNKPNLISVECPLNGMSWLNLSNTPSLFEVWCYQNNISELDFTGSPNFSQLYARENNLTVLDFSQNPNLTRLDCAENFVTELDLSQQPFLTALQCSLTPLTCLNVKNGGNNFITFFGVGGVPNLDCIEVDDPVYSANNWTGIDPQINFTTNCANSCSTPNVGLEDFSLTEEKKVVQTLDIMGREINPSSGMLVILIYDDGTSERRVIVK